MLKKAGIVVAASAAGILAFSPLAFAGSSDHDANKHYGKDDKGSSSSDKKKEDDYDYKVSEDNDTRTSEDNSIEREQYNECYFEQDQESFFSSPVLGAVPALGGQTQTLNCTNVGDTTVLDLDGEEADVVVPGTPPATP